MGKRTRLLSLECTAWGNATFWRMRALAVLAAVVVACVSSLFGSVPAAFAADEMPELELRNSYQLQSMTVENFTGLWTVSHDGTRAIISDGEQTLAVDLETGSETPLDFDQRWVSSLMPIGERDFIINSNGVLYRYGDDLEPLGGLAGSGYSVGTMCFPVADESKLRFPASRDGRVYAVVYDLEAQSVEQEIAIDSDSTGMWISNDLTRAYIVQWIDDDGSRVIIVGYDMASGKEVLRNEQINPGLVGGYPFFVGETDDGWPILFDIAGAHYFRIDPESGEVVPFVDRAGGTNSIPILGNELSTVVVSVGAGGSAGDNLTADDIGTAELQSIDLSTGETLYSMSTSVFARDFHGFAGYSAVTRDGRYFYQGMYDADGIARIHTFDLERGVYEAYDYDDGFAATNVPTNDWIRLARDDSRLITLSTSDGGDIVFCMYDTNIEGGFLGGLLADGNPTIIIAIIAVVLAMLAAVIVAVAVRRGKKRRAAQRERARNMRRDVSTEVQTASDTAARAAPVSGGSAPAGGAAVAGGMGVPGSAVPAPTTPDASNVQGQPQESQGKRFCPYCGKPVGSASAKYCTSCGKGLPE